MSFKTTLNPKYFHFKETLENLPVLFSRQGHTIHKARNELKTMQLQELSCVVKAFKVPNWLNQFVYVYIRNSKAYKSFHNAMKLQALNVATPTPIGFIEFFKFGLLKESFFISKEFPYDFTMAHVRDENPHDKKAILEAFATFTYEIHQKGVWHVDYSGGNILISRTENGYNFSLVDINRMKFRSISHYEGLENFNKMWFDEVSLTIIATAYAKLADLDIEKAIQEILIHDRKLKQHVLRRRQLKAFFKGKK